MLRTRRRIFWGCALSLAVVLRSHAQDEEKELKLSFWDKSVNLRGAFGYKDNVLLSSLKRDGSGFWQSAIDFSLIRAPLDDGPAVTFFVSGEDRRYFSAPEVGHEDLVLAQAKVSQEVFSVWTFGGLAQYLYADQVLDASSTEQLFLALPVISHNMQLAPFVGRQLPWKSEIELKFTGERQLFKTPLDDYWELGPQLTFTKRYGNRSSASLSYGYDHRRYDTRNRLDSDFIQIEATSLQFHQHEFEGIVNHSWDQERHWRSRFRLQYEINEDNAFGFYDYSRYRASTRFGYYGKDWLATIEGKILYYDYRLQPVPAKDEVRQLWEYALGFRAEKTVWKTLKIFAEDEYEQAISNFNLEEYNVNTFMLGVDWEF